MKPKPITDPRVQSALDRATEDCDPSGPAVIVVLQIVHTADGWAIARGAKRQEHITEEDAVTLANWMLVQAAADSAASNPVVLAVPGGVEA
jgi:hypothetical protein